jgi:hypothetical protein
MIYSEIIFRFWTLWLNSPQPRLTDTAFVFSDVGNYLKLGGQVVMWRGQSAPSGWDRVDIIYKRERPLMTFDFGVRRGSKMKQKIDRDRLKFFGHGIKKRRTLFMDVPKFRWAISYPTHRFPTSLNVRQCISSTLWKPTLSAFFTLLPS